MNVVEMKISDLKEYENNPRNNDAAVNMVANSIEEFGFRVPILIDKDNVIIAGHTRLKAAKFLEMEKVPVIRVDDLTPEQVRAFRLVDNKVGEIATWDMDKLDVELNSLSDDFYMEEFGFDMETFDEDNDVGQVPPKEVEFPDRISVIVECKDNEEAEDTYNKLTGLGYKCRVSTL